MNIVRLSIQLKRSITVYILTSQAKSLTLIDRSTQKIVNFGLTSGSYKAEKRATKQVETTVKTTRKKQKKERGTYRERREKEGRGGKGIRREA